MNRKLTIFVAAYFLITMLWAYPWHVLWFHEYYIEWGAMTRQHPIMWMGMIAIFIQGIVIGYLYPYCKNINRNPILDGIRFNLIVGLMTYTAMGFATAAKIEIEPATNFLLTHSVFQFVQFTLTGAALGLTYKCTPKL